MRIHRYTQWDGTQEILFPTTDDIINQLSDHLLEEEGVRRALRGRPRDIGRHDQRGDAAGRGARSLHRARCVGGEREDARRCADPRRHRSREAGDVLTTPVLPGLELRLADVFKD